MTTTQTTTLGELETAFRALRDQLPEGPTHFGPFSVELEAQYDSADPGRGAWVDCWITTPDDSSTGSLAMLESEGEFMNGDDAPSERLLTQIRAFAVRHGY